MGTPAQDAALERARAAKAEKEVEASMPKTYRVRYLGKKQGGYLMEFPLPYEMRSMKTGEVRLNPEGTLTEEQFEQFQAVVGDSELFEIL